jgi:hypothetical protein
MMTPLTAAFLLAGFGVFLWGLARIIDLFRPR